MKIEIQVVSEQFLRGNIERFQRNINIIQNDLDFLREMGSPAQYPMQELALPQIEKNKRYIELNQVKLKQLLN